MTDWDLIQDDELQEHLAMAQGLAEQDAEAWGSFQEEVTSEWEKRVETTKKAEAQRRRREAQRYAASPEGKLAALRKDLAAAEQTLAESDKSPTPARLHPDLARDLDPVNAARIKAAQDVAGIKAQVAELETRLPFTKVNDDQLLNLAADAETILTRCAKRSLRPTSNSATPALRIRPSPSRRPAAIWPLRRPSSLP